MRRWTTNRASDQNKMLEQRGSAPIAWCANGTSENMTLNPWNLTPTGYNYNGIFWTNGMSDQWGILKPIGIRPMGCQINETHWTADHQALSFQRNCSVTEKYKWSASCIYSFMYWNHFKTFVIRLIWKTFVKFCKLFNLFQSFLFLTFSFPLLFLIFANFFLVHSTPFFIIIVSLSAPPPHPSPCFLYHSLMTA